MQILVKNKQQGFTLIEILIVIAIITVLIGVSSLSINLAKPSEGDIIKAKIENTIELNKKFAKNYNKETKIFFDYKNKKIIFYWLETDTNKWNLNKSIKELDYKNFEIISDLQNIIIKPNGFVDDYIISITQDKSNWEIKTEEKI